MINLFSFINTLKPVDVVFIIVCVAIVAIAVGIYFLIPVLNKKQYKEQRDNLRKREEAFKSNLSVKAASPTESKEQAAETNQDQE